MRRSISTDNHHPHQGKLSSSPVSRNKLLSLASPTGDTPFAAQQQQQQQPQQQCNNTKQQSTTTTSEGHRPIRRPSFYSQLFNRHKSTEANNGNGLVKQKRASKGLFTSPSTSSMFTSMSSVLSATNSHLSDVSLPDRLGQALKGVGKSFSKFNNASGAVTANDVVYFSSNANITNSNKRQTVHQGSSVVSTTSSVASSNSQQSTNSTRKTRRYESNRRHSTQHPSVRSVESRGRPSLLLTNSHSVSTLEQLRHLYNSAPDFAALEEELDEHTHQQHECDEAGRTTPTPPRFVGHKPPSGAASHHLPRYSVVPPHDSEPFYQNRSASSAQLKHQSSTGTSTSHHPIYANLAQLEASESDLLTGSVSAPVQPTSQHHLSVLTGTNHSPTDSGYRSVSRHLNSDQSSPALMPAESTLSTTVVSIGGSSDRVSSSTHHYRNPTDESNCSSTQRSTNQSATSTNAVGGMNRHVTEEHNSGNGTVDSVSSSGKRSTTGPVPAPRGQQQQQQQQQHNNNSSHKAERQQHQQQHKVAKSSSVPNFESYKQQNGHDTALSEHAGLEQCPKLTELDSARLPWSERDIVAVLQRGRCKSYVHRIGVDVVPRMAYLLQRPLLRLALMLRRLCAQFGYCSYHDVRAAATIILCPSVAQSCIQSAIQATSLFAMEGGTQSDNWRHSRQQRAGLHFAVGRFHQWMNTAAICAVVNELAVVYVVAIIECLMEEIVLRCVKDQDDLTPRADPDDPQTDRMLSASQLDDYIASDPDLWGLLQPYAHLITSRTADGKLLLNRDGNIQPPPVLAPFNMSNWSASTSGSMCTLSSLSLNTNTSSTRSGRGPGKTGFSAPEQDQQQQPADQQQIDELAQCLLATCVGGARELGYLIARISERQRECSLNLSSGRRSGTHGSKSMSTYYTNIEWSNSAITALYHYMRCSELNATRTLVLVEERCYSILPCLSDWLRVCQCLCAHRRDTHVLADDVLQAAAIMLPNVNAPPTMTSLMGAFALTNPGTTQTYKTGNLKSSLHPHIAFSGQAPRHRSHNSTSDTNNASAAVDASRSQTLAKRQLGFNLLLESECSTDLSDVLVSVSAALGARRLNTPDVYGLTPLMWLAKRGSVDSLRMLVDAGADVNAKVACSADREFCPRLLTHFADGTALSFAVLESDRLTVESLIQMAADIENAESTMETPLQLASVIGDLPICARLMECGADAFQSTMRCVPEGYGYKQKGAVAAIAIAAAHGHRQLVHIMLSTGGDDGRIDESVSLADFLAETSVVQQRHRHSHNNNVTAPPALPPRKTLDSCEEGGYNRLTRPQQRSVQQAMYYAAEHAQLDIAVELRNFGVPWSLYTWTQCFLLAFTNRRKSILQLLLLDATTRDTKLFDEITHEFVDDAVPQLVECLQSTRNETSCNQLALVLNKLYAQKEPLRLEPDEDLNSMHSNGSGRIGGIDAKFVNNPELSDVQFLVQDRLFYGHRIVLVNASGRLKQLLMDHSNTSRQQPISVKHVDYDVFQLLMEYLYSHELRDLTFLSLGHLLQLLSAAQQFDISTLVRICETRITQSVDVDNVVEIYRFSVTQCAHRLTRFCESYFLVHLPSLVANSESFRRLLHSSRKPQFVSGLVSCLTDQLTQRLNSRHHHIVDF